MPTEDEELSIEGEVLKAVVNTFAFYVVSVLRSTLARLLGGKLFVLTVGMPKYGNDGT